jgi:hypothetical protein
MAQYRKLIVAVLVPILGFGAAALGLEIGSEQITMALVSILTAAGVFAVPNA